jgi:uncharacterized membrane protein YjdF
MFGSRAAPIIKFIEASSRFSIFKGFDTSQLCCGVVHWLASLSNPADTEAFLGTQGYIWDTQSDMAWCLIGSIVALIMLTKLHNKYLLRIGVG